MRVLFVCTGNICRSPMAEGLFRHRIRQAGLEKRLRADSAGTHGYHVGNPPDERAIAVAARHGIDIRDLRARQLDRTDFQAFDLLLGMDEGHLAFMRRLAPPQATPRIGLLLDQAPQLGYREVPDPYYGEEADYRLAFELVEAGVEGLIRRLAQAAAAVSA
ncbi:MAG: low molecular weight protein-tyrosine-phosphatase [Pseudomonadota bacterium]